MKKKSFSQRFRYWFDNVMSGGTKSLLLLLAVITAVVAVTGGLIALMLGGADGSGGVSPGRSIWFTLMHAINTGVLAKEEGTVAYLAVMTVVTLVGIFITSFLIGTISNAIKEKVTDLQRGKSQVIESGHTVIIGFNDNIINIIEELAEANANQQNAVVVIMAEADKVKMEDTIRDQLPKLSGMKVVCRSGKPDSPNDLAVCSLETCKSIIVNINDDFMTVKTLLTCRKMLDELGNKEAFIIATIRDREIVYPAKVAGGDRAEVLNFQKTIARLMVQSTRHPGMSEILSELLSFKGNEIYVEEAAGLEGLTLSEINLRLPRTTAIGIVREGRPMLNCGNDVKYEAGDRLIRIDLDDDPIEIQDPVMVDKSLFAQAGDVEEEPHTLLIFGYTDMLRQILIEEDAYAAAGSRAIIAVEPGKIDGDTLMGDQEFGNIQVDVRECDIYKRNVIEELLAEKPSSIMLMSDMELGADEADSHTLMLQLQLNDIAEEIGSDIPLTIEMNKTRNQRLSQMMRATDFVVSSNLTAKMMVQIAEQRHNKEILDDLLSEGGSTISMKSADHYVLTGEEVDFYTLSASAARFGETAIGYKKYLNDGSFEIRVNPSGDTRLVFESGDDLIVIAKN